MDRFVKSVTLINFVTLKGWTVFIQPQFLMTALSEQILDNCDLIDFVTLIGWTVFIQPQFLMTTFE